MFYCSARLAGWQGLRGSGATRAAGFTLLELLVVLAIIAMASAGVGFAMRDGTQSQLEREALRLSALLESARAQSQLTGVPVRWQATEQGFRFDGLAAQAEAGSAAELPTNWLDADTQASVDVPRNTTNSASSTALLLGPEPIIEPQSVTLASRSQPGNRVYLATDGVRPFAVQVEP